MLPSSPAVGKGEALAAPRADLLERCYAEAPTLGAFEAVPRPFPSADTDGDRLPDDWESANGLDRLDPADALEDADTGGWSNLGEFLAGTDPRNAASRFVLKEARVEDESFTFRYATLTGRIYRVQAWQVAGPPAWTEVSVLPGPGEPAAFRETGQFPGRLFRVSIALATSE